MSGVGSFNIGGLASGLDTNSILSQLMQIERTPVVQLQNRQTQLQKVETAWSNIVTKLSALRGSIDAIRDTSKFAGLATATSSNTDALTVAVTGSPTPGSVQLVVEQLAYAAQRASGDTEGFTSLDSTMGTRQLTIHAGGEDYVVNPVSADTTLSEFVGQINRSGAPVRAQAVQQNDGTFRLVLTAKNTGLDGNFTLTATNWNDSFDSLQAAQDAQIRVGDAASPLVVTRSSNVVSDVIEGVTVTLKSVNATPVTVSTAHNVEAGVKAVRRFVDEANALLQTVKDFTAYNADSRKAQSLAGDRTARQLTGDILSSVSRAITGITGDFDNAGALGISLTRDGLLTLDEATLREALNDDWEGAVAALGRNGASADERVRFVAASDSTVAGAYTVVVTQAAAVPSVTGTPYAASAQTLTITSGGKTASITTDGTEDLPTLLGLINDEFEAEGMTTLRAEDSGGALRIVSSVYGSDSTFTVASDGDAYGMATGAHAGVDVAATVEGVAFTGKGQTLTSDTGDSNGLVVRIQATAAEVAAAGGALNLGDVTVVQGVMGQMSSTVKRYEGLSGEIQRARDLVKSQIELFQERIERIEVRLVQREITLRRQFTAMETAMNQLAQQGNRLASALSSLGGGR